MTEIDWPDRWPEDAQAAVAAHFGSDERLRIIVGDPVTSIDGSLMEGFVYLAGNVPTVIYDRSGRPDVHPWPLPAGPVLRIYELRRRRRPRMIFAQNGWSPRRGE